MIKLVATDIDGTIFIPEKEFTLGVTNCIKKLSDSGIKVVLVTGRMNAAAAKIAAACPAAAAGKRRIPNPESSIGDLAAADGRAPTPAAGSAGLCLTEPGTGTDHAGLHP